MISWTDEGKSLTADWLLPGEKVWLYGNVLTIHTERRVNSVAPADVNDEAAIRAAVEGARYPGTSTGVVPPYSSQVLWNRPVSEFSEDSRTTTWTNRLFDTSFLGNFNLAGTVGQDYTYPVYVTSNATTTYTISTSAGNMNGRTVPWNPAWTIPSGSDAQIILLNPDTGEEYNGWQLSLNHTTKVISGSRFNRINVENSESVFGTVLDYRTGSGIFRASRGCGLAYRAMLTTPEEIEAGVVRHALTMVPLVAIVESAFVAPATKSDGSVTPGSGIPTGARLRLAITDAQIDGAISRIPSAVPAAIKTYIRILFVAFRDYGAIIADRGGGKTFAQCEHEASALARWTALGLGSNFTASDGKEYPRDAMDSLVAELGGNTSARAYFRWVAPT